MPKAPRRSTRKACGADTLTTQSERGLRKRTRVETSAIGEPKPKAKRRQKYSPLVFLARSPTEVEVDVNRYSPLLNLPREVVHNIAHKLPLASAICLTLACKLAADIVGTWSWAAFKKEHHWAEDSNRTTHRKALFQALLRDWNGIGEYCPTCNSLHPPLKPPRTHRETKFTKYCFGQDAMIDYLPQNDTQGYSPVLLHIEEALKVSESHASKGDCGPDIDLLVGDFTIAKQNLNWRLLSSGRRIDGNLIIKHVHTFTGTTKNSLCAADLLALPVRLCPHQSTTTAKPEPSRYLRMESARLNVPMLTHAINVAFPPKLRAIVNMAPFKKPTPSEKEQMSTADAGEIVRWRCRSCPTKFQLQYHAVNGLQITTWHSFGRDLLHARQYWKRLVRRQGPFLGTDKRNDEWWSTSKTFPEFKCGEEDM